MFPHRYTETGPVVPVLVIAGMLTATSAAQAARVDARQLTCQQARSLVQQNGAVVMSFTNTAYDGVVKNRLFCDHGLITKPKYTQTLDHPRCHVGGICIDDPWKDTMRQLFRRN